MIPNEVCVFVANDNILKSTVTILVEETLVDNCLKFRFQFIMRNSSVKSREIERIYTVDGMKRLCNIHAYLLLTGIVYEQMNVY